MENWIYATLPILWKVILTVLAIFTLVIIITRISGLRTFAKMSNIDFASTIAIGSILATVVMHPDQSILKGAVALAGVVTFQTCFSLFARKSDYLRKLLSNEPILLMYYGDILDENLTKANVSRDELIAKLREANALNFDQVLAVVLETTGDMSVLHTSEDKMLLPDMLQGVRGIPNEISK